MNNHDYHQAGDGGSGYPSHLNHRPLPAVENFKEIQSRNGDPSLTVTQFEWKIKNYQHSTANSFPRERETVARSNYSSSGQSSRTSSNLETQSVQPRNQHDVQRLNMSCHQTIGMSHHLPNKEHTEDAEDPYSSDIVSRLNKVMEWSHQGSAFLMARAAQMHSATLNKSHRNRRQRFHPYAIDAQKQVTPSLGQYQPLVATTSVALYPGPYQYADPSASNVFPVSSSANIVPSLQGDYHIGHFGPVPSVPVEGWQHQPQAQFIEAHEVATTDTHPPSEYHFQGVPQSGNTDAPYPLQDFGTAEPSTHDPIPGGKDLDDTSDDGSLFGDNTNEYDGSALAEPSNPEATASWQSQLSLPGSAIAAVSIPGEVYLATKDGIANEENSLLIYDSSKVPTSSNPATLPRPQAINDPMEEDIDEALQREFALLQSPSLPLAVPPASGPEPQTKRRKSHKKQSTKGKAKDTSKSVQKRRLSKAESVSLAVVQFREPFGVWIYPATYPSELRNWANEKPPRRLIKIPAPPAGLVCCLPPIQTLIDESGQVVSVVEEETFEPEPVFQKRVICSFAIDTSTPAETEAHFALHRIALENRLRVAGIPNVYHCRWHYDERDKNEELQSTARGFRKGVLCHEAASTSEMFPSYDALAEHWNRMHAGHKIRQRICPMPQCMEVISNDEGSTLAEHLEKVHTGYVYAAYCR
ncbi:hypothetical protein FB446DRAFT_790124 [Lentinula raphanica]|nr:hypothetical protein FB446DRAFT_790124 [Lentinula raphanica]